jgi:hypothetical protein
MELSIWRWLEMVQTIWMEKCGKKRGPCFPLVFTNMGGKLLRADGWIGRQARRQASQEAGLPGGRLARRQASQEAGLPGGRLARRQATNRFFFFYSVKNSVQIFYFNQLQFLKKIVQLLFDSCPILSSILILEIYSKIFDPLKK